MPQPGVHTFNEGAWHYCGRCGSRAKLDSELQWQLGKLLCDDCFDQFPVIIGAIEQAQAMALAGIISNPDLRPNRKLTNPDLQLADEDILL